MSKKQIVLRVFLALFLIAALVQLDFTTKELAIKFLKGHDSVVLIPKVLELTYVTNKGAVFGMMQGKFLFFYIATGICFVLLIFGYSRLIKANRYVGVRILFILLAAGTIGNLYDRITRGFVVDMISAVFINFPVFNVADIYVTVSVFALIVCFFACKELLDILIPEKEKKSE